MNYVIDRIEGEYAVLYDENKESIEVEISKLYSNYKEGDWLKKVDDKFIFDQELTEKMRKRNSELLKKLMNKG